MMTGILGCEVDIAIHGQDALDKIKDRIKDPKKECYKLVFMDCNMPVLNGYQTASRIKKNIKENAWPEMRIVATTAYNF